MKLVETERKRKIQLNKIQSFIHFRSFAITKLLYRRTAVAARHHAHTYISNGKGKNYFRIFFALDVFQFV